ncbi:hypothetical protein [Brachyspira alvinipulli]|uniref:hypothetical protein n=1 Tax=Brachyspira alvinipulli TaxID=84379 RepID=UPI000486F658|nr:hypothetical protein [Brachyspira alvinipulli]
MSKKITIILSILFSFFVLSCGNSSDAYTSASQKTKEVNPSKGITNYIGDWNASFANNNSFDINIKSESDMMYNNLKVSSVEDLGNDKYKMNIESDKPFSVSIKFQSDTEGTIEDDSHGIGTILKK